MMDVLGPRKRSYSRAENTAQDEAGNPAFAYGLCPAQPQKKALAASFDTAPDTAVPLEERLLNPVEIG